MGKSVPDWLSQALPDAGEAAARLAVAGLASEGMVGRSGFALTSAAFKDGEELDPCFTAAEEDAVAPPLEWSAPPSGAMELALVVEDLPLSAVARLAPALRWLAPDADAGSDPTLWRGWLRVYREQGGTRATQAGTRRESASDDLDDRLDLPR